MITILYNKGPLKCVISFWKITGIEREIKKKPPCGRLFRCFGVYLNISLLILSISSVMAS